MKILIFYLFGLFAAGCAVESPAAKQADAVERRILLGKKSVIRFEKVDTIDGNGRRIELSKTYFFDKNRRNLLLITVYENQFWPHTGYRLSYVFSDNRLVKVVTVPSRIVCRHCNAQYYFSDDSLVYKNELNYSAKNIFSLLDDSKRLSSKVLNTMQ